MTWREGDLAIIRGDTGELGHCFDSGTEVELLKAIEGVGGTQWNCGGIDNMGDDNNWWVAEKDLGGVEPSDDEIQAAIESIAAVGEA